MALLASISLKMRQFGAHFSKKDVFFGHFEVFLSTIIHEICQKNSHFWLFLAQFHGLLAQNEAFRGIFPRFEEISHNFPRKFGAQF